MTLVRTNNPFARSFDGLMNDLFTDLPSTFGKVTRQDAFTAVNIVEKADHYHLQFSAPGFDKSDFSVKLEGATLTVGAEKAAEAKTETDKVVRKEFSTKSFKRSFTLDEKIDGNNISAKYENGILHVGLPKKAEVKAETKDITIN